LFTSKKKKISILAEIKLIMKVIFIEVTGFSQLGSELKMNRLYGQQKLFCFLVLDKENVNIFFYKI